MRINIERLWLRLEQLAKIGEIPMSMGSSRLALTTEDRDARDLVVTWMQDLGMAINIDLVGNVVATWIGDKTNPENSAVMTGSHIDTVRTGGRFDGNLGVLAGLEVVETLAENNISPTHPISVAFFTGEEGARFAPDMLGSLVYVGGMTPEKAYDIVGIDGARFGDELARIGYNGSAPCPGTTPKAFVELHIEQGPVLEAEGITIGAVDSVQGISWSELSITGVSNHAGTTPMNMRKDPLFCAAEIARFVRQLSEEIGNNQVGTVGKIDVSPNLVNVVAANVEMTVDLRNTDEILLRQAEDQLEEFCNKLANQEGVKIKKKQLARFEPVAFDLDLVQKITEIADSLKLSSKQMPSGAGHDAQMFARICPSAMIFVPSQDGLSHNPKEFTSKDDIEAGGNTLLRLILDIAGG